MNKLFKSTGAVVVITLLFSSVVISGESLKVESIEVYSPTALPSIGLPVKDVPYAVQTATAEEISEQPGVSVADYMVNNLEGVTVNEVGGNPYQLEINYRGYNGTPLVGNPQGLSIYVDGVRQNMPFSNNVLWDTIPDFAIDDMQLVGGSNAVFGLNTLGGSLSMQTKSGRTFNKNAIEGSAGSWNRKTALIESGGVSEDNSFDDIALRESVARAKFEPYINALEEKLLKLSPPTGDVKKVLDAATIYSELVKRSFKSPSDPMPAVEVMRMKKEMESAIDLLNDRIGLETWDSAESKAHVTSQNRKLKKAKQAYNRFCEVQGIVSKFAIDTPLMGLYDAMVDDGLFINADGTFKAHLPTRDNPVIIRQFKEKLKAAYVNGLNLVSDVEITDAFALTILNKLRRAYDFSTSREALVDSGQSLPPHPNPSVAANRAVHRESFGIKDRVNASTVLMCAERVFNEFDELMDTRVATVGSYTFADSAPPTNIRLWQNGETWEPGILTGILDRTRRVEPNMGKPLRTKDEQDAFDLDKNNRTKQLIRALYRGNALSAAIEVVNKPVAARNAEALLDNLQHYGSDSFKKFLSNARYGDGSGGDKFVASFFETNHIPADKYGVGTANDFLNYVFDSAKEVSFYGEPSDLGYYRDMCREADRAKRDLMIQRQIEADFLVSLNRLENRYSNVTP